MKLFKIVAVKYNRAVSVFPPEDQELPEPPELAGDPWLENFRALKFLGYTDEQAARALYAWAYHARHDLHQAADGVRFYVRRCVVEAANYQQTPPPSAFWPIVLLVAVVVAVSLALYVWVVLDPEYNILVSGHPWAYLMAYEERLWQGEILNVGLLQEGLYEQQGQLGPVLESQDQNAGGHKRFDWLWISSRGIVLGGRRPIFYHEIVILGFVGYYCGLMYKFADRLYKLKDPILDNYKPTGPWIRPGGRGFTDEYEGCWQKWWWL